jgi:integrase
MLVQKAIQLYREHQNVSVKQKTRVSYDHLFGQFETAFGDRQLDSLQPEEICQFLDNLGKDLAKSTRHLRYAQIKAFLNFIIDTHRIDIKNPCSAPALFKSYKLSQQKPRKILDKETVDEIIFNSESDRDRLILELQARCGLRVGEVLKLKASDVSARRLMIQEPKSGKDVEVAFMPEHIAKRLADYITEKKLFDEDRVFHVSYTTVRNLVMKLGNKLSVRVAPHDLRRHSATYASRNGVPLEIVSKVILRHQDLKTTQVYLGKVSDSEAIRWMDVLHGK